MKKLVEVTEINGEGLDALLGERVLLMCANYFYSGKLIGINDTFVQLSDPAIVYETGEWKANKFVDEQRLHAPVWYVQRHMIESFGVAK